MRYTCGRIIVTSTTAKNRIENDGPYGRFNLHFPIMDAV